MTRRQFMFSLAVLAVAACAGEVDSAAYFGEIGRFVRELSRGVGT